MAKPAKWDSMTPSEQEAWRVRKRESNRKHRKANPEKERKRERKWREANPEKLREHFRKYREANREKRRESSLKSYCKSRQQTAADQFFILAGAAESISKLKLKSESHENNTNDKRNESENPNLYHALQGGCKRMDRGG
jgi:hypothetical protein